MPEKPYKKKWNIFIKLNYNDTIDIIAKRVKETPEETILTFTRSSINVNTLPNALKEMGENILNDTTV